MTYSHAWHDLFICTTCAKINIATLTTSTWVSHITHMKELRCTHERVVSHVFVTHMNESLSLVFMNLLNRVVSQSKETYTRDLQKRPISLISRKCSTIADAAAILWYDIYIYIHTYIYKYIYIYIYIYVYIYICICICHTYYMYTYTHAHYYLRLFERLHRHIGSGSCLSDKILLT